MQDTTPRNIFTSILSRNLPAAFAQIQGNADYPHLIGFASFYTTPFDGILINTEVYGLPGSSGFYGMHIHEFGDCTLPFAQTGNHYNPTNMPHPLHAGDMPPLLNNNNYAWMSFYTEHLRIEDIIGKSIIIHSMRDDFTTQPSGDSGDKIGCGVIQAVRR